MQKKVQFAEVLGSRMQYLEMGEGDPILLLHGIPGSSYVWRNLMPVLAPLGRCLALDFIGMGQSDRPSVDYTIEDHIRYVQHFIEIMRLEKVTLVMHGFGSLPGLAYALSHSKNCKGLVFYESFLRPLQDQDLSLPLQEHLQELAALSLDQAKVLASGSAYIDKFLALALMQNLSAAEIEQHRSPYPQNKGPDKVLLQYWQALAKSSASSESKVDVLLEQYSNALTQSALPKLLLYSLPGFMTTMATISWAKKNCPRLEIGDLGEELHFAQEGEPRLMAQLISTWLQSVEQEQVMI